MRQPESEELSVVLVSQFFHPDTSANSVILSELAVGLANLGMDVSVITTQPSYTETDRDTKVPKRDIHEEVSVRRIPATRFDRNEGIAKRMANELTFFLSALIYLLVRRRGDVLLLPTAPTFLPIASWPLHLRGYRSVPIVMDLYPAMAVQLGYIDPTSPVRRLWNWMNKRAYRTAATVITIGETIADRIQSEYGPGDVRIIHNWEDGDFIQPQDKADNTFAQTYGFDEDFTLIYSGNLGQHHDLASIVEAARILESDDVPSFEFVFIGDGGEKQKLQQMVEKHDLNNITFLPYQPVEVLPDSLTAGDVSVVTMAQGVEGLCVSSKFYTALASGQAVLAVSDEDAEIAHVVKQTGCGIHVDSNDAEGVADAIRVWLNHPKKAEEMGEKAREVFEAQYTKDTAIESYRRVLTELA